MYAINICDVPVLHFSRDVKAGHKWVTVVFLGCFYPMFKFQITRQYRALPVTRLPPAYPLSSTEHTVRWQALRTSGDPDAMYTLLQTGREDGARIGSVADDGFCC
jgi:hypothetical protein